MLKIRKYLMSKQFAALAPKVAYLPLVQWFRRSIPGEDENILMKGEMYIYNF